MSMSDAELRQMIECSTNDWTLRTILHELARRTSRPEPIPDPDLRTRASEPVGSVSANRAGEPYTHHRPYRDAPEPTCGQPIPLSPVLARWTWSDHWEQVTCPACLAKMQPSQELNEVTYPSSDPPNLIARAEAMNAAMQPAGKGKTVGEEIVEAWDRGETNSTDELINRINAALAAQKEETAEIVKEEIRERMRGIPFPQYEWGKHGGRKDLIWRDYVLKAIEG